MQYEEFQKALDVLKIVSRASQADIKNQYQKLSKIHHPDMPDGDEKKFQQLNEAYKLIQHYIKNFRFKLDEDEFYEQNPFSKKSNDWFYDF